MKKVYFAFLESPEMQGMFDENNNLLSWWYCNDGNWRGEYFDDFLLQLGIEIVYEYDTPAATEREKLLFAETDEAKYPDDYDDDDDYDY